MSRVVSPGPTDIVSPCLRVEGLGKQLDGRALFRRLDFAWDFPGVMCVRGPTGAGKTPLHTLLAGATAPDAGRVLLNGYDPATQREAAARQLAFVPDDCPVYPFISGREWLAFTGALHGTADAAAVDLVARLAIEPHLDTRFGAMSLGTARKFMLAAALATEAPILIMDEPMNGLDSASFEAFKAGIRQRAERGLVILTCHDVRQQEQLGARAVELSELEAA